jgi:RNA polymerase subunit RPABC4/transcription elongation factor Spt4
MMNKQRGVCPACNGTKKYLQRFQVENGYVYYEGQSKRFDETRDLKIHEETRVCYNCGAQKQYGEATGMVLLREDGTPCLHDYESTNIGRCYTGYSCKHCGDYYTIDSSD